MSPRSWALSYRIGFTLLEFGFVLIQLLLCPVFALLEVSKLFFILQESIVKALCSDGDLKKTEILK